MKTKFFAFVAIAALCVASCTQESLSGAYNAGEEVTLSFVVEAPGAIATKAFSDGTTAAKSDLQYAVYPAGKEDAQPLIVDKKEFTDGLKTTVEITLVRNKEYDVIFWAQNEAAPYTFDAKTRSVTIDYKGAEEKGIPANDETLDAFYFTVKGYKGGDATTSVKLSRPFAQINVGANDMKAAEIAGYTAGKSSMTVANVVPNTINLYTEEVSGEATVNFTPTAVPTGEKFPVEDYEYIAMNYILAAKDQTTTTVSFVISSDNENNIEFTIGNVPVRRNYQTNLYGSILTTDTVWNVEINPIYNNKETDTEFNKPIL